MKILFSDNYEELLSQARSMENLIESLQNENSYLRKISWPFAKTVIKQLESQLESEREMNRILTDEILKNNQPPS